MPAWITRSCSFYACTPVFKDRVSYFLFTCGFIWGHDEELHAVVSLFGRCAEKPLDDCNEWDDTAGTYDDMMVWAWAWAGDGWGT